LTDPKARAVTVRIGGKDYPIRSDADPAYTRRCAEYVDNRISGIGKDLGALDIQKLTILAALSITDRLFQMQEDDAIYFIGKSSSLFGCMFCCARFWSK
jgi:cell division protein ZapA (FtsZ GTPase activity inhibitor)